MGIIDKRVLGGLSGTNWEYNLYIKAANSSYETYLWNSNGNCGVFTGLDSNPVKVHVWTNFTLTSDGSNIKVFKDGILVGQGTKSPTCSFSNGTGPLTIGVGGGWNQSSYFDGMIDDISIFNRSLTTDEVQALYQGSETFDIAVTSNPQSGGSTNGGGTFNYGDQDTVRAVPNTGYTFVKWTENGNTVSTSSSYLFTVSGNRNLVANFSLKQFTVSASSNPVAGGSTFGGGTFNYGVQDTVKAVPNTGYTFENWTENGIQVSTSSSFSLTVIGNRNLVANYAPKQFTVSTSPIPTAGGLSSGDGNYITGVQATVSAKPNPGYTFINWTEKGNMVSTLTSYSFTVDSDRKLIANFVKQEFIIITVNTSSNPTIAGTTTGGGAYTNGNQVTVTAIPAKGCSFVIWTENSTIVSTSATYTFVAKTNRNLVANFALPQSTITTVSNPQNGGITYGEGIYENGTQATVSVSPKPGYSFINWTENGVPVSTNPFYAFMVNSTRALVANFLSPVGIKESSIAGIQVYPNPVSDKLNISLNKNTGLSIDEIILINSIGAVVYRMKTNDTDENVVIDIQGFKPGIYYMLISDKEKKKIAEFKIVMVR